MEKKNPSEMIIEVSRKWAQWKKVQCVKEKRQENRGVKKMGTVLSGLGECVTVEKVRVQGRGRI